MNYLNKILDLINSLSLKNKLLIIIIVLSAIIGFTPKRRRA